MKKFLLVVFVIAFPVLSYGATYYVAKTGSDSNSCNSAQSQSTPKLTINAGIACLSGGDTLIVKAGTYPEVINASIPSGTAGAPTLVQSEVKWGAILRPSSGKCQDVGIICFDNNQNYIIFDSFDLDAINLSHVRHVNFNITANSTHHITIRNNRIRNGETVNAPSNTDGIVVNSGHHHLTIQNNTIHDIGTNAVSGQSFYDYGIYYGGADSTIEGNEIYNCSGYGIHNYNTQGGSDNNVFRNNYIHNNFPSGGPGMLFGDGGSNNTMYNNIIANNGGQGIDSCCGPSNVQNNRIYNNTIFGNGSTCMKLGRYTPFVNGIIRNNICYGNGEDSVIISNGSGNIVDRNLLGTDPLFVNAAATDFHLRAGSPAIDAGVVISGLPYNGSAPDLGALESGAGVPPPTNLVGKVIGN
jgi:hypothetical protein